MSGINKVILIGNVGKDPETKYLEGGIPVTKFSLATTETYKDKSGKRIDKTEWHNIVLWRGLAEVAEKYVKKGQKLYIEGKIQTRSYGEDNNKKYITEIVGDNMTMLTPKDMQITGDTSSQTVNEPSIPQDTDDLPF